MLKIKLVSTEAAKLTIKFQTTGRPKRPCSSCVKFGSVHVHILCTHFSHSKHRTDSWPSQSKLQILQGNCFLYRILHCLTIVALC